MTDTPKIQVALDMTELPGALAIASSVAPEIDLIECGTLLILSEGLGAVRAMRAIAPGKTVLADVRIAEAGGLIARECFGAGADWVTCVAGASETTIEQVVAVAREFGGEVQVELGEAPPSAEQARRWHSLGVQHVIVKRSRDLELSGTLNWTEQALAAIDELSGIGFTVSVTGSITVDGLDAFAGRPVDIVIAGREIVGAEDPLTAARTLRQRAAEVFAR